jgi:predicted Zn-dependent protease with MMP-like domain
MMKLNAREFDRAVQRAVKRIPGEIRKHLDNLVISVQKWPSEDLLEEMGLPPDEPLLGVYTGASLMERSHFDTLQYPDTIQIFQGPLEEMCVTMEELEEEIEITVVHEVAHFIGMTEEELAELGYE